MNTAPDEINKATLIWKHPNSIYCLLKAKDLNFILFHFMVIDSAKEFNFQQ